MRLGFTFTTPSPMPGQPDIRYTLPIPMVYENTPSESFRWEYRVLTVDTQDEPLPGETDLNELGNKGWILVGVLSLGESTRVHYYFVRQHKE